MHEGHRLRATRHLTRRTHALTDTLRTRVELGTIEPRLRQTLAAFLDEQARGFHPPRAGLGLVPRRVAGAPPWRALARHLRDEHAAAAHRARHLAERLRRPGSFDAHEIRALEEYLAGLRWILRVETEALVERGGPLSSVPPRNDREGSRVANAPAANPRFRL